MRKHNFLPYVASFSVLAVLIAPSLFSQTTGVKQNPTGIVSDFEPRINYALREIKSTYGDNVSVDVKAKSLLKFGRNEAVGTGGATLMTLGSGETDETYISTNAITHIASDDAADTQDMVVEGMVLTDGVYVFTIQTVTLAGTTKTALDTPLVRCTRAYNNGSTDLAGDVYIAEDVTFTAGVPQTASAIHLIVDGDGGHNQSEKCSTSTSYRDYWIITNVYADVLEKTAATADIEIQVRLLGKVFRNRATFSAGSNHQGVIVFDPPFIVPPNSDIRLRAVASGANTDISGGIQGYLASVDSNIDWVPAFPSVWSDE